MPSVTWSFLRYCIAGGLGLGLNLALTALGHEVLGLGATVSFAIALASTYVFNFLLARHLVFRASSGPLFQQIWTYGLTSLSFRLLELFAFGLIQSLIDLHYLVTAVLVLGTSFVLKFAVYRRRVFVAG